MNAMKRYALAAATLVAVACGTLGPRAQASENGAEVIVEWNRVAQESLVGPPFPQIRAYAMLHIAMADAVLAIEGGYRPFHAKVHAPAGASARAAAAQAGHDVLVALLPARKAVFDAALATQLTGIPPGKRQSGISVGRRAAEKILTWRQNDGYATANPQPPPFLASELPGIWRQGVTGPALFADIGSAAPFGLLSPTQFLPAPPPQLESDEYAEDFNDVKSVGRIDSTTRTDDQAKLAQSIAGSGAYFNHANPLVIWLNVIRDVAAADRLSLAKTARLFALVTASMHDSLQTSQTSKFVYRLWRPETAVPAADIDNNPATVAEAGWRPLLPTPPYPSHSSNASCIGVGAARMLANVFDTDAKSFTATWYVTGPPRTVVYSKPYTTFSAFGQDMGSSRIWGGIHYRFEIDASEVACTQVADYVFDHYMRPRKQHH